MVKDFLKLETFLIVARERSFSKASAKLGISQPAVTQKIKSIERFDGDVIQGSTPKGIINQVGQ